MKKALASLAAAATLLAGGTVIPVASAVAAPPAPETSLLAAPKLGAAQPDVKRAPAARQAPAKSAATRASTASFGKKTLKRGSRGTAVKNAQKRLLALGYWLPKAQGTYDAYTQQAVWALQKAAGLKRTGTLNAATRKALSKGVRPKAKSKKGHVIEVNKKRQLLLIVNNGRVSHIFNTSTGSGKYYKSSTGRRAKAVTPSGKFKIYRQINGPRYSRLGYLWRPKYFTGGIAIHGEKLAVPPYPASHGCVRVTDAAMNWIWKTNQAPKRTSVWVY